VCLVSPQVQATLVKVETLMVDDKSLSDEKKGL